MPVQTIAATRIWPISLEQIEAAGCRLSRAGAREEQQSRSGVQPPRFDVPCMTYGRLEPSENRPVLWRQTLHHRISAVRNIESLRSSDESVDALIEMLTSTLTPESRSRQAEVAKSKWRRLIIDAISQRVLEGISHAGCQSVAALASWPAARTMECDFSYPSKACQQPGSSIHGRSAQANV